LRFFSIHKLNDSKPIGDAFSPARRFELKRATGQAFEPIARARLRSSGAMSPHWHTPFHPQILLQTPGSELTPEQSAWLAWATGIAETLSPFSAGYPDPLKHGAFDPAAIPFGGPYPSAQNFTLPPTWPPAQPSNTSGAQGH
jgi:hypothetical protein